MNEPDLDLDAALGDLPTLDLPAARTEALRARAHAVLAEPVRARPSRSVRRWRRAELGFAVAVAAAHLFLVLQTVSAPYR